MPKTPLQTAHPDPPKAWLSETAKIYAEISCFRHMPLPPEPTLVMWPKVQHAAGGCGSFG
jgi:hypothetical protein